MIRRATTVSLFTALGVLAGFAVDVLLVARFGVGTNTDAFFGGYTVPLILVTCLMSINPVLVTVLASAQRDELTLSVLLNASILAGLAVSALGALLARPLVAITTPGFDPATAAQAARLARILFGRVAATAVAEVCKAELYVRRRFALAACGYMLPSLITALLLALPGTGWGIEVVAFGLVAGTLVQALMLIAVLLGHERVPYHLTLRRSKPILSQTGRLVLAPLAGLLLRQGVTLAERFFGSHLAEGSVTALSYANRLTMTVAGVAFDGITTASLPSLAERWDRGPVQLARDELAALLRLMTNVALPLGLMLAALGTPLVLLFFERGQVSHQAALLMGATLSVYLLSLPSLGPFRAAQTFFYAVREMRPIVILHGSLAALTVLLDSILVGILGAPGLALAFALSSGIIAVVATIWLARRAGEVGWRGLRDAFWRLGLTSVAVAAAAYAINRGLEGVIRGMGRWGLILNLSLSAAAGFVVFAGLGSLLKLEAILVLKQVVRRRWAARTRTGS